MNQPPNDLYALIMECTDIGKAYMLKFAIAKIEDVDKKIKYRSTFIELDFNNNEDYKNYPFVCRAVVSAEEYTLIKSLQELLQKTKQLDLFTS